MIEAKLRDYLRDSDAIRDRVGRRVAINRVNQGVTGELLILRRITNSPIYDLINEAGIEQITIQIDSYSNTPANAESLARLVRNRFSGYRGYIGTVEPVLVQSVRIISEGSDEDPPEDGSDNWRFRYRQDYEFYVGAAVPTHT